MSFLASTRGVSIVGFLRMPPGEGELEAGASTAEASKSKMTREERLIQLYDQLRPSLLAYLGGLGLSLSQAEDIIQESFVRLFDHFASKGDHENPKAWLFRVAHNMTMDLYREGQRFEQSRNDGADLLDGLLSLEDGPEEHVIRIEQALRVRAALGRLTEKQRTAVLLRAEDLRYREIAAILGVSVKRVSHLVQRALSRLAGEI
jgi:RNA polymerase sigma-70 factor, ECF subfamily